MDLSILPDDVILYHIFPFISSDKLAFCDKKNWENYYKDKLLKDIHCKSYCRFLLRNDNNFVFKYYFQYYFSIIIKPRKIKYKSYIFKSYFDMIRFIINMEYNSHKCLKEFIEYSNLNGMSKKKYKKIKTRINKWNN